MISKIKIIIEIYISYCIEDCYFIIGKLNKTGASKKIKMLNNIKIIFQSFKIILSECMIGMLYKHLRNLKFAYIKQAIF